MNRSCIPRRFGRRTARLNASRLPRKAAKALAQVAVTDTVSGVTASAAGGGAS